jgi:hypothetical protein
MWTVRIYEERRRDREIREGKKDGIWYPPLGRHAAELLKKKNFSQNQNLPRIRYLKGQCLQDTNFEEISYTSVDAYI